MRRRNKDPIKVNVFYPETEEGMHQLRSELGKVMVSIVAEKIGPEKLHELRVYMEKNNINI